MRRRKALSLPIAATALAAAPPAAHAGETWCDVDPLQLVVTSGGALVPIFVTNGAPSLLYAPQLLLARITHITRSVDGGTATLVTVTVTVPNTLLGRSFPCRSVITRGPAGLLDVYATATGVSGAPMVMTFTLPIA
jgi:hypothetical protein